jgi:hypothetical protein
MKEAETIHELSVLGGPLQRLGCRLGLVRGGTNTVRLGLALGLLAWGVLMLLALLAGFGPRIFSLSGVGVHVRFLVAIPLLFLCETLVAPRMAEFARNIVRSGLVPEPSLPALASDIRRVRRLKDSWLAEVLVLLAAIGLPMIEMIIDLPGRTGSWASILHSTGGRLTWMTGWYLAFCLPLFRFLVLRWLWRLGLWWYFLWCVQRLELRLVPTHSDGAAGLGYLEIVHESFAPLVLATSAVYSGLFAEAISSGTMAFETLYSLVPMVMVATAALFIGPLFLFSRKLWLSRQTGMTEYMGMASRYVNAFDSRWIRDTEASGESQLGAADLQSLADLTNSVNVVRGMRSIPASQRLVVVLAASVILPLLPLVFLKYPVDQVVARLFQMLTGL